MLTIVFAAFIACFVLERFFAGSPLPKVPTWPIRVIGLNLIRLAVVVVAGEAWEKWFQAWSIFDLGAYLGNIAGGLIAYFIGTFVFYWGHRWRHESGFLWRHFHQIHHSPQRIEVITSFYKHPFGMAVNSLIGSVLVYLVLGLSSEAGAIYTLCTALGAFFFHTHVRTPRWVGFVFQGPEMHCIRYQHCRHRNNYGDIIRWDMMFGTYENPRHFQKTCGFAEV